MRAVKSSLFIATTLCVIMVVYSCNDNTSSELDQVETWDLSGATLGSFTLPSGTIGYADLGNTLLTYSYPKDVYFLSYGPKYGFQPLEGGCLDCFSRCEGCKPKKVDNDVYCSRCSGQNEICSSQNCGQEEIGNGGGFVDLSAGISFVPSGEFSSRIDTDYAASFEVIMMHPKAKAIFEGFVNELWGHNPSEKELRGSQALVANVFGKPLIVKVPADYQAKGLMRADETKCECKDEGEKTGCKLKKDDGYALIEECTDGTCVWCRMTF